jgi:UDPglucose 6-dehydrogenase
LKSEGARIRAYDPAAMANARELLPDIEYCSDAYEVARGADALVVLTEWEQFAKLDLSRIKGLLNIPVVIDGRNIYDPQRMKALGFEYRGIGR